MSNMTDKMKEKKQHLINERNVMRTTAQQIGDKYTKFRIKCIERGVSYKKGIEQAMDLWLPDENYNKIFKSKRP